MIELSKRLLDQLCDVYKFPIKNSKQLIQLYKPSYLINAQSITYVQNTILFCSSSLDYPRKISFVVEVFNACMQLIHLKLALYWEGAWDKPLYWANK